MLTRRRAGFTLIELLVVIAIIAILAAMLFPVFARARESARKIQCLSNVKNIAMAVQIYLTDYDSFPPYETDRGMKDFWWQHGQSRLWGAIPSGVDCYVLWEANPYLRWPVVLEEYIKNRDVWKCPSAKWDGGTGFMVPAIGGLLQYYQAHESEIGAQGSSGLGPCDEAWPPGWGGTVTDSLAQLMNASPSTGGFAYQIYCDTQGLTGAKLSRVNDAANTPVCADGGTRRHLELWNVAYPDVCRLTCTYPGCNPEQCEDGESDTFDPPADGSALTNPSVRAQYARHLGGDNVGFADGHAAWFPAMSLITAGVASAKGEQSPISLQFLPVGCGPVTLCGPCAADCNGIAPLLY
jgi:prepilin-type N-terminal cleavage/methylation domain-containing protein/prepilin-type processing-associated H-X9-DG protein